MIQPLSLASFVVLIAEDDVIVRFILAEYLRSCGLTVIEAAGALEAKMVLQHGPHVDILFADAQLAGADGGFGLAQWVRKHRPEMRVVLTGTLRHKTEAAAQLCDGSPIPLAFTPDQLLKRIQDFRSWRSKRRSQTSSTQPRALVS